jgi:hypothetical protein
MMNKLYAVYELISDLNDLPDEVLCLCPHCALRTHDSDRTYIELDPTPYACTICEH